MVLRSKEKFKSNGEPRYAGGLVYSKMPPSPSISIVVTTYNRSDALIQVLGALSLQDDRDFEIVIADDGSTQKHQDVLFKAVAQLGLSVTHVWHPDVGFTASRIRNRGVAAANGSYVILLDGDCVPDVDFVRQHRRLREHACFVNGSRVLLSQRFTQSVVEGATRVVGRSPFFWIGARLKHDASKLTGLLRLPNFVRNKTTKFLWKRIRSCNMGVWRADYLAINGFDESFVGWGHEDADFVLRLHNLGVSRKNGFCATEVYHLWHPESSRTAESKNAQKVRDRIRECVTQPTIGYRESEGHPEVSIKRLG
jgi:GT2 family glycosyltransferase